MRIIFIVLALSMSLAACGVRGDPEAPPDFTKILE
jgi:predicted small lipoprotein YifL